MSRWFITVTSDEPNRLKTHWLEDSDLARYGIKGTVGEEYHVLDDNSDPKSRIVGEIGGQSAALLNAIIHLFELLDGGERGSQDLRYNVMNDLVQDVVRAAKVAKL